MVVSESSLAVFELGTRLIVGVFLIARGASLLTSVGARRQVWLAAHQLLPTRMVGPVAMGLPVVELFAGTLLLFGAFSVAGPLLAGAVLVATTTVLWLAVRRGRVLSGGSLCRLRPLTSSYALFRNVVFIVAVGIVGLRGTTTLALAGSSSWRQSVVVATMIAAVSAVTVVLRQAEQRRNLVQIASF
ncbi:MauE/DoxX family redox-associated membrane protein [Nocardia goodfellowii]